MELDKMTTLIFKMTLENLKVKAQRKNMVKETADQKVSKMPNFSKSIPYTKQK